MQLKRTHRNKKARALGRGGKRGKTSGRGTKGQKARAGHRIRPAIRDVIKKLPRRRGVTTNKRGSFFTRVNLEPVTVSLSHLVAFKAGERVTPAVLVERGVIGFRHGALPTVKLVGDAKLPKLSVALCRVSKGARAAIERAGGTIA